MEKSKSGFLGGLSGQSGPGGRGRKAKPTVDPGDVDGDFADDFDNDFDEDFELRPEEMKPRRKKRGWLS